MTTTRISITPIGANHLHYQRGERCVCVWPYKGQIMVGLSDIDFEAPARGARPTAYPSLPAAKTAALRLLAA